MTKQLNLFDAPRRLTPRDTHLVPDERPRLSGQNQAILERLRRGPATNRQLMSIALNYRARISDLRAHGYDVQVAERDHKTGYTLYELKETR